MNVLLVDGSKELGETLEIYLRDYCNFKIIFSSNYKEAFEVLIKARPDLVIIDYLYDGEECIELVKLIRQIYPSSPKIVIMTTNSNSIDKLKEMQLNNFIIKPFTIEELDEVINYKKS